jgi:two-component system NarL family sensor kinase
MQEDNFIFQIGLLATAVVVIVGTAVVILFRLSIKQKKKHWIEKQEAELQFLKDIHQTKIEIKDETLKQVAIDLHDNIGQLIALSRIHIKTLQKKYENEDLLLDLNGLTENSLNELRMLTHTLNQESTNKFNLINSLNALATQINRTGKLQISIDLIGDIRNIYLDHAIILYRIVQEFVSNTLKYSEAETIKVELVFLERYLKLSIKDNGIGFEIEKVELGNGLKNMKSRADFINASITFDSELNKGTILELIYNY